MLEIAWKLSLRAPLFRRTTTTPPPPAKVASASSSSYQLPKHMTFSLSLLLESVSRQRKGYSLAGTNTSWMRRGEAQPWEYLSSSRCENLPTFATTTSPEGATSQPLESKNATICHARWSRFELEIWHSRAPWSSELNSGPFFISSTNLNRRPPPRVKSHSRSPKTCQQQRLLSPEHLFKPKKLSLSLFYLFISLLLLLLLFYYRQLESK